MKTHTKLSSIALIAAAAMVAGQANAEIEGSVTAGYSTEYEFRGATLGDDLAEATLALSTEYQGITFGGSIWYASTNDVTAFVDNEVDYSVYASKSFGAINASLGYIYYTYPEASGNNTGEIYLSLSTEVYAGITATVTGYYDIDLFDGWFVYADLGKSFALNDCVSLNLNAGLGMYESYSGFDDGINHYYVKAALAWTPKENLTITPYVKYTDATSDFPADFTTPGDDFGGDNVVGGLLISVAF